MRDRPIIITERDAARLRLLLRSASRAERDQAHLDGLAAELERAQLAPSEELPTDAVGLGARARVLDLVSGQRRTLQVVLPWESDPVAGRVSVLAPLGTALLGYRTGDEVEWEMPGGLRRLRIEGVEQPGTTVIAAGNVPPSAGVAGVGAVP